VAIIRPARPDETPTGTRARTPIVTTYVGLVADVARRATPAGEVLTATIFEPTSGRFERLILVAAADPAVKAYKATVDACEEVIAALHAARVAASAERVARLAAEHAVRAIRTREQVAATPTRGATVEVIGGEALPLGLTGAVFWAGPTARGFRVGVEPADGGAAVFVNGADLKVIRQPKTLLYPGRAPADLETEALTAA
jgi:hypothetical protein